MGEVHDIPDQPNRMIAIATDRERTIHSGALITVTSQRPGGGPADLNEEGASYQILTPSVPLGRGDSPDGRYRTPFPLNGTQILTSWANGFVSDRNEMINTAPDFGVYLFDSTTGMRTLVYDRVGTWELEA